MTAIFNDYFSTRRTIPLPWIRHEFISAWIPSDFMRSAQNCISSQVCAIYNMTPRHDGWNHALFSIAILLPSRSFFLPFYTCTHVLQTSIVHMRLHALRKGQNVAGDVYRIWNFPTPQAFPIPSHGCSVFKCISVVSIGSLCISVICLLSWKLQFAFSPFLMRSCVFQTLLQ